MSDKTEQYTPEIESLISERKRLVDEIKLKEESRGEFYFKDKYGVEYGPGSLFAILTLLNIILVLTTFICDVFLCVDGKGLIALIATIVSVIVNVVIGVINMKKVYPRSKKIGEIDDEIKKLCEKAEQINAKLTELGVEIEEPEEETESDNEEES